MTKRKKDREIMPKKDVPVDPNQNTQIVLHRTTTSLSEVRPMPQLFDMEELTKKNPQVDRAKVKEVLDTVAELQRQGVPRANYSVVSPYSRTRSKPASQKPPKLRTHR